MGGRGAKSAVTDRHWRDWPGDREPLSLRPLTTNEKTSSDSLTTFTTRRRGYVVCYAGRPKRQISTTPAVESDRRVQASRARGWWTNDAPAAIWRENDSASAR